jgi:hypothetical protein
MSLRLCLFLLAPLLSVANMARADVCFTVLDPAGHVLHQSRKAPVDMSRPISQTLYQRFPRASLMVFGSNNDSCPEMLQEPAAGQMAVTRRMRRM